MPLGLIYFIFGEISSILRLPRNEMIHNMHERDHTHLMIASLFKELDSTIDAKRRLAIEMEMNNLWIKSNEMIDLSGIRLPPFLVPSRSLQTHAFPALSRLLSQDPSAGS